MHRALVASLTTFILGLYGIAATAADTTERCADGVTLVVANFREAWQYCLRSSEPSPRFIIHTRKSSVERWPRTSHQTGLRACQSVARERPENTKPVMVVDRASREE